MRSKNKIEKELAWLRINPTPSNLPPESEQWRMETLKRDQRIRTLEWVLKVRKELN